MNLYSNKQRWKIALLIIALATIGASLFVSNNMVSKIANRERKKAEQWADAIQKRVELVQFTNATFDQLREKERQKIEMVVRAQKALLAPSSLGANQDVDFALEIINENKDIPVLLLDDQGHIMQHKNILIDTAKIAKENLFIRKEDKKVLNRFIEDSLMLLAKNWKTQGRTFDIEVFEGFIMTYVFDDSRTLKKLERNRDSLLNAFNRDLINDSQLVPVLLLNKNKDSIVGTNFSAQDLKKKSLQNYIADFGAQNPPIKIDLGSGNVHWLFFDDSAEVKQLFWFPYIQFSMLALIVIIGYLMFSTYRKAEQNQVWAGMAKETAHQLGTPLSSLMAWVQHLEASGADEMITNEMQKDLDRLEKITDRFSKIGSGAKLVEQDLVVTIGNNLEYLSARLSDKIEITYLIKEEKAIMAKHNASLIEWVVENICKNAVDAMSGKGKLKISMHCAADWVHIDIQDSGKGIPPNQFKAIFQPGFSTKKRGWGLGLTLVKRIIEEYHKGKVYVLSSDADKGTTFRISLPL